MSQVDKHFWSIFERYFFCFSLYARCWLAFAWEPTLRRACKIHSPFILCSLPLLCCPLCPFRRKLHRGGKEQMELWLCPTELWPGKLTFYRKQNVCLTVERLQKMWEGKKTKPSLLLSKPTPKKEAFKTPLQTINMGRLLLALVWLTPNMFLNSSRREGSWGCCVTKLPEAAQAVPAVHTIPLLEFVCIPSFSPSTGPTPQLSWEQQIHHHAGQQAGTDTGGSLCWVAEWRHQGFIAPQTSQRTPVTSPSLWHSSAWVFLTLCCSL